MGLLDRFKRSSSKEPSLEEKVAAEIEDFKGQLQAQADSIREDAAFNDYIAGKVEEGYRRLDERYKSKGVVAEFSKSKKETEQEFIDTHKKIITFRKEYLQAKKEGLLGAFSRSDEMDKFNILYHSNSYPKRNIDKIFLPYLLEKLALGIISNDEKAELNAIFGKTGKAEDIKDATSVESFATDYDRALIMLAALNLLDYDNSGIIQGYDNSRNITYNNGNKRVRGLGFLDDYSILSEAKRLVESLALQSDLKGISKNQSNDDIEPEL